MELVMVCLGEGIWSRCGVVAPIPIHAQGNTDGDSSRPGFCSVLTPEVVDPFLPEKYQQNP
eukprot:366854-Amorphochlora_amoeboformis.AAC.1